MEVNKSTDVKSRITFIELNHHFEVLRPMLELVDLSKYKVQVAVRSIFYEQFQFSTKDEMKWVLFPDTEVERDWIDKIGNLRTQDLVVVVTSSSLRKLLAHRMKNLNYALLVHNYIPTFHPFQFDFDGAQFRDYLRGLKFLLYYPGLRRLLRGASHIFFLNEQIHPQLASAVKSKYPIVESPPIYYRASKTDQVRSAERKLFVVPGTVKQNGRNYQSIAEALQLMSSEQLAQIHLHFLGAASSHFAQNVIRLFRALEPRGLKVTFHEHAISLALYDQVFQSADLIVCPFLARFRLGLHTDQFGLTSISGTMNDLIRFGKPALVSQSHPFPKELERSVVRYLNSEDLGLKLAEFLTGALHFELSTPEIYHSKYCRLNFNQWLSDRL